MDAEFRIEGTLGGIDAAAIRVGFISASLLAAGCASDRQAYPQAWPSIATPTTQTCAQIVSTYRDSGETAPGLYGRTSGSPASLTKVLHEVLLRDVADQSPAERVTFSFPQVDQLQLVVSGSSGQLFSVVLTSETGKFVCRKGTVIMRPGARWYLPTYPAIGAGRTATTLELHPMDDYLVVAEQEHGLVLVGFLLPIGDRSTRWFRFERTPA